MQYLPVQYTYMVKFAITNIAILQERIKLFLGQVIDAEKELCLWLLRVVVVAVDQGTDVQLT